MTGHLEAGRVYTANQMNDFIGGKHQGGIRYSGNFPDIKRIGVVIGGGADAIYADQLHRDSITYIGEGQRGDQQLTFGNRALVWAHFQQIPAHVFINLGKNRYEYRGPHIVENVSAAVAVDRDESNRGALAFQLRRDQ
jgi:hypothetical protein